MLLMRRGVVGIVTSLVTMCYLISCSSYELGNNANNDSLSNQTSEQVTEEVIECNEPDHGLILLDVATENLPSAYKKYGIKKTGVVILESRFTSLLKYGDKIISVNGVSIITSEYLEKMIDGMSPGDEITFVVSRGGKRVSVTYRLGEKLPESVEFD